MGKQRGQFRGRGRDSGALGMLKRLLAMIKKGLTKELGSRENMENAIETAIYMFSIGQDKQWGPVLRGEIAL